MKQLKIKIFSVFTIICCSLLYPETGQAQTLKERWQKVKKSVKEEVNDLTKQKEKTVKGRPNDTSQEKNESLDVNFEPGLLFKAPNSQFESFEVQKHNGLPRFGAINSYERYTSKKWSFNKAMNAKIKEYESAKDLYALMIKTKDLSKYYAKLNRDILYTDKGNQSTRGIKDEETLQRALQSHLKHLAFELLDEKSKSVYFSNPESKYPKPIRVWGGRDSDEFRQLEVYNDFVENNLEALLEWSKKDFLPNNELEYYEVLVGEISREYDFENKGYSISGLIKRNSIETSVIAPYSEVEYVQENEFEYHSNPNAKDKYGALFMELPASSAKNLKNQLKDYSSYSAGQRKKVFLVRKVKMKTVRKRRTLASKNSSEVYQEQKYNYSFSEPFIEVYADEGLKNKIGQIKMFLSEQEDKNPKITTSDTEKASERNINKSVADELKLSYDVDVPPELNGCEGLNPQKKYKCFVTTIENLVIDEMREADNKKKYNILITITKTKQLKLRTPKKQHGTFDNKVLSRLKNIKIIEPAFKNGLPIDYSKQIIVRYY